MVKVDLGYGDGEVDADSKSSDASEQTDQDEQAAQEFSEGREIGRPARKTEALDELNVMVKSAKNFVVSVAHHDSAEGQAHNEQRNGLQAIEVAQ